MKKTTMDGNTAAAHVAYAFSDVSAIYPITPSSTMAELVDEWQANGKENIFGKSVRVVEMQSEAGAAGAVHGSLVGGALTTTFTASQGLLLMIPNMYKIAGELLPCVFHVAARALATHALSIFGDHSDVMACRQTGFAMLCSSNIQESMDLALVSHLATLNSSVPFIHFFDGFRTSHEIQKIDEISYDEIKGLVDFSKIEEFRKRSLDPSCPHEQGTAQNPDIYFQNREACNSHYNAVSTIVSKAMEDVFKITGRKYQPFDYYGSVNATDLVVMMGSGSETTKETIDKMISENKSVGIVVVRLYRPFDVKMFINSLPKTVKRICVLDRTKESGSVGEPLYLDIVSALCESNLSNIKVIGGRYGLGGKEFTPACVRAVFENLSQNSPINHFTVGINDDVTNKSLTIKENDNTSKCYEMKFYGLGSDGTVSANKNSIKIIGDNTDKFVQGYFEYDSKKSGSLTISHLRVSEKPIRSTYNVQHADFIACHNYSFLTKYDILSSLKDGGTVLLNTIFKAEDMDKSLPKEFVDNLKRKKAKLFVVDATLLASKNQLGSKINIIMQTAFFKITNIIDFDLAQKRMEEAVRKTYGKKGEKVVSSNINAISSTTEAIQEIDVCKLTGKEFTPSKKCENEYYNSFIKPIENKNGDSLPVSSFDARGIVPTDTAKFEKRGISLSCPQWKKENCIQCGRCVMVCPHAALRAILTSNDKLTNKPERFETVPAIGMKENQYRIQLSPLDCTGCSICANICPAKNKALEMVKTTDILEKEKINHEYSTIVEKTNSPFSTSTPKGLQFKQPYFEFSGACAGCGETPYIKLATQLFGDKMVIANATGCSSIYGGSSPSCPYSKNIEGQGPAWANSLFEDNAEFGMGIAIANATQNKKNKSVWIIGGDGWAYDIGYGGLDHLLNAKENVNILVLDTEVYSNTGGQASKSTPAGSMAKFASSGKKMKKKDLGLLAIAGTNAYVASISLGADMNQAIKAMQEAEAYDGPSLILAYSPCINHGINLSGAEEEMKRAVDSGYWTLYRYNPSLDSPLAIDSPEPTMSYQEFLMGENRYSSLLKANPENAKELFEKSQYDAMRRRELLKKFL